MRSLEVGDTVRIDTISLYTKKAHGIFDSITYGTMEVVATDNDFGDSYVIVNDRNQFACFEADPVNVTKITSDYIEFYNDFTKTCFKLTLDEANSCIYN